MATLTNPIQPQNIVNRFADYVVATANSGIVWGSNRKPFGEMATSYFGGTTAGRAISISGGNIGAAGGVITASTIYNVMRAQTQTYSNIRKLRARLFVTGTGGNTGSRPTAGYVYDQTRVAHLNTNYRQSTRSPSNPSISVNQLISKTNLETFFSNCRTSYNQYRAVTATIQTNVCHASCHSSCHGSRGRR